MLPPSTPRRAERRQTAAVRLLKVAALRLIHLGPTTLRVHPCPFRREHPPYACRGSETSSKSNATTPGTPWATRLISLKFVDRCDPAQDRDSPLARGYLELQMRRGRIDRQIGPHPAADRQIFQLSLPVAGKLETLLAGCGRHNVAGLRNIHHAKIDHHIIESRILPIHSVKKPRPVLSVRVHFADVSHGFARAHLAVFPEPSPHVSRAAR